MRCSAWFTMRRVAIAVALVSAARASAAPLYVHPVPSLPSDFDPVTANDVFSISAIAQIHESLFRIDSNSVPLPNLVDSFGVSQDQLDYTFDLRNVRFHDGTSLSAEDAKFSIERAVTKKAAGYERLQLIAGFQAFVDKKAAGIAGITAPKPNRLVIHLTKPFPSLIETLADVRFSILSRTSKSPMIGLGPYIVKKASTDELVLQRRPEEAHGPNLVSYVRASQPAAIEAFAKGDAQDLFAYSLKKAEVERLSHAAVVQIIQSPRTYLVAVNPRLITKEADRDAILARIDVPGLINACYPDNARTASIVPPGFPGYLSDPAGSTKAHPLPRGGTQLPALRIAIAQGVDAEECVAARLQRSLAPAAKRVSVDVVDADRAVARWQDNSAELLFAYIEGENTLDMFQNFNPNTSFSFGVPGDRWLPNEFASYNLTSDPSEKHRRAEALSTHILSLRTVLPLFHPKQYIVYSKLYKPMKIGVRSSTFIEFASMEEQPK